ncbi:NAD(+)/NADH kinase [Desulfocurvibacter africanus]|uniref:NAD kinase n=1 Tax=Desulfocurvibacter africanus subsp. africanus str. Walvis Bay TaxID=690850 RepID=F3Z1N4_DESAF|nr:NAD(+)/NADH kinase [Desulfocurvibacter africanus]EGJ51169.1 inorganic polyphosphate/ATP-NAD kinase [Desulfocurvibacter africanus subsp. africanus str. Walvis Bay]
MPSKIECIHIVTKMGDRVAGKLGSEIAAWLAARGVSVQVQEHRQDSGGSAVQEPCRPDMALVLGGDGTLLSVARKFMPTGIPLLGINVGHLGFLAKADVGDWPARLEKLLELGLDVDERLALHCEVLREGQIVHQSAAINDVVVSRGPMARLIRLRLFCEGELVAALRADGVIVSSPTGSTAYAISAGGPLIHPALEVMGVTAICAFMGNLRSLVIPADLTMDILVEEVWGDVFLTEDGQQGQRLVAGDLVRVTKAKQGLRLVHLDGAGYFTTLQDKGFTR